MGVKHSSNKKSKDRAVDTSVYSPVYLKFNFSYMNKVCRELSPQDAVNLSETLFRLSNRPWLQIMSERKSTGFETIPLTSFSNENYAMPTVELADHQFESGDRKLSNKRDIFRIRNAGTGRIIGRLYRNIFYVFYIDFDGKAYDHE